MSHNERHSNDTIEAKIARLRERLKRLPMDDSLRGVLLGFLDLLEDEL
jgi:hypothetical protein